MKKYSCFDVIFDNQLAHIILNRPEKRNSMTTGFWKEFPEIVSDINQEGIIRSNNNKFNWTTFLLWSRFINFPIRSFRNK